MPCEPCNELAKLEAQIEDLHFRLKNLQERRRQARIRRNHVHSPLIHRFPHEIVAHIFTLAFPPRDAPPCCPPLNKPKQRVSPLVITNVCHTWRAFASSMPRLWSDISVDVLRPNFALLDRHVAYSDSVPLSIHLSATKGRSDEHTVKQAMCWAIKQLHHTSSFFLDLPNGLMKIFDSIPDLGYPKAAPFLKQLHVHCPDRGSFSRLRLATEPPCLQHVVLDSASYNRIYFAWTTISSLTLELCCVDGFPELLLSKHLKQLALWLADHELPTEQTLVVNHSIEALNLRVFDSARFMLTKTSLPSLQKLELDVDEIGQLCPMICDFLRRSLCPLQDLTIIDWSCGISNHSGIALLMDVLESTDTLQQLTLRLGDSRTPVWSLDPLVRRLSSQDRTFLPCLKTLALETQVVPPFDLWLDTIGHTSEVTNGPNNFRPLHKIVLDIGVSPEEIVPIPQDVVRRIFQLRATGKVILINRLSRIYSPVKRSIV